MSLLIIIFVMIIQFVVQYFLYQQLKPIAFWSTEIVNVLKFIIKKEKILIYKYKIAIISMTFINIFCSVVVFYFTSVGAVSGITNLGASVLVGIIQVLECKQKYTEEVIVK